jgi:hypothetical protein
VSEGFTKEQARTVVALLRELTEYAKIPTREIATYTGNDVMRREAEAQLKKCEDILTKLESELKD